MKYPIRLLLISFLIPLILSSCSMTNNVYNKSIVQLKKYRSGLSFPGKASIKENYYRKATQPEPKQVTEYPAVEIPACESLNIRCSVVSDTTILSSASLNNENYSILCDEIILRNGTIINGKVKQITETQVIYITCTNKKEEKAVDKNSVFMIKYHSGINEVVTAIEDTTTTTSQPTPAQHNPETEQLSTISLVLSLAGLVVGMFLNMGFGILISLLAFVFAIISVITIDNSKKMKKGTGSAVAAIIISVFTVAVCLYTLSQLI